MDQAKAAKTAQINKTFSIFSRWFSKKRSLRFRFWFQQVSPWILSQVEYILLIDHRSRQWFNDLWFYITDIVTYITSNRFAIINRQFWIEEYLFVNTDLCDTDDKIMRRFKCDCNLSWNVDRRTIPSACWRDTCSGCFAVTDIQNKQIIKFFVSFSISFN